MKEPGDAVLAEVGGEKESPTRVVVVDDDEGSLRLLRSMLENDGNEVACFTSPGEALKAMLARPPDVLVVDWVMPTMDGPDVLRKVRGDPKLQGTYCVLVTAHDMRGKKVAGLLIGADDYLTKPISETELLARIRVGVRVRKLERHAALLTMAATLGHEINNPLTGVLGYLEMLERHVVAGDRENALDALHKVQASAERIRDVVGRLLALSSPKLKKYTTGTFMLDLGTGEAKDVGGE